jgi:hypothetical protein
MGRRPIRWVIVFLALCACGVRAEAAGVTEPPARAFGPVVEQVVEDGQFFDFDSGRPMEILPDPLRYGIERTIARGKEIGADAIFFATGQEPDRFWHYVNCGMDVMPLPPEGDPWSDLTADGLAAMVPRFPPDTNVLRGLTEEPLTVAIRTREGGRGILQFAGFRDDPPGIRLRYKMLLPPGILTTAEAQEYAAAKRKYLEMLASPELNLHDARAAMGLFTAHEDWPALADASEAAAEVMWRVIHMPPEAFVRPAPEEPAGRGRENEQRLQVQTDLDGTWANARGGPENWLERIKRKQTDLRAERVELLLALADLCRQRLNAPDRAVAACETAGRGVPLCTEPLETLIPQIWPKMKADAAVVVDADSGQGGGLPLEARINQASWLRSRTLQALAGAQEAAGDLNGAARTRARCMLAALIGQGGDWNANYPMREAEEFWRVVQELPPDAPVPPTLWLTVLDREHADLDFPAPEEGPHGLPFSEPGPTLVVRPGLTALTLTVSADMETPGGTGGVRCFTWVEDHAEDLGSVSWYPDERPGREWRTETFWLAKDVGIIRVRIVPAAGHDFHVRELKIRATFAPGP